MNNSSHVKYPHLFENIKDWPAHWMGQNRAQFIERLNKTTFEDIVSRNDSSILDILEKTIYQEKRRIKTMPWSVDPRDEKHFWEDLGKEVTAAKKSSSTEEDLHQILERIVHRYNEEIVGNFKEKTFLFARKFLTILFKSIHNSFFTNILKGPWGNRSILEKKMRITGYTEEVRQLFKKTTVVLVPTHQSNIDSIIIGYTVDANWGLPAFYYGAGLNLFNFELAARFMNRLGTYKVDRRKKNPIYLECLKNVVREMNVSDVNNLVFPGGTRARDGRLESKVKLGLLGAILEAQRDVFMKGENRKIVIVPVITSFHYILEAKSLIEQYLKKTERQKYSKSKQQGKQTWSTLRFIRDIFTKRSDYVFSVGRPMDAFGNSVDAEGNSIDEDGNIVDITGYFKTDGSMVSISQRERVYTSTLGERIVETYQKDYVVLSSHLVAHTAFEMLLGQHDTLGLMSVLNLPKTAFKIKMDEFQTEVELRMGILKRLAEEGKIRVDHTFDMSIEDFVKDALYNLGQYHANDVLFEKNAYLESNDFRLLFYYHNRLDSHVLYCECLKNNCLDSVENAHI